MNTKSSVPILGWITLIALLLGVIGLVVMQIVGAETATKTESALYNVLQFIFSFIFAWVLTRIVTEQQFVESQRKFAIGAFRRIKEIERSLNRTQRYLVDVEGRVDRATKLEFVVIRSGLTNTQDAVRSSIADWADIIGDEIEVANEIHRLKQMKSEVDDGTPESDLVRGRETSELVPATDERIQQLLGKLPAEMRVDMVESEEDGIEAAVRYLGTEWQRNRALNFDAFWEPKDSFSQGLDSIKVGDTLSIARGITQNRTGALLVYKDDDWVAVVTNCCTEAGCGYDDFVDAIEEFYGRKLLPKTYGGTPLLATVISMEPYDSKLERQYFQLRVDKLPDHSCVDSQ